MDMRHRVMTMLLSMAFCMAMYANGVYDVRDYGAKGDGRTLDHLAINRAIDACVAGGGGQVRVPAGTAVSTCI